jgi:hypothetical protein
LVHILQHIKKGISETEHTLSYYSLSELKWQLVSQLGYHDTISDVAANVASFAIPSHSRSVRMRTL